MDQTIKEKNNYILRFDRGEDFIAELTKFANENIIACAHFSAIGAATTVTLSFYNLKKKRYEDSVIKKDLEIVNITGNIALKKDPLKEKYLPFVHAHGVFSDKKMNVYSGHVKSALIGATCEVYIRSFKKSVKREYDKKTGLFLLSKNNI